jgi:short-subunit dehydrogenase
MSGLILCNPVGLIPHWWKPCVGPVCAAHRSQLRLLCNCAGILHCGSFEAIEMTDDTRIVQVNVLRLMQVPPAAFPYLKNMPASAVTSAGCDG